MRGAAHVHIKEILYLMIYAQSQSSVRTQVVEVSVQVAMRETGIQVSHTYY